jgi:hypothetical protein
MQGIVKVIQANFTVMLCVVFRCGKRHYPRAMRIRTRAKAHRHSNLQAPLVRSRIDGVHGHSGPQSWAGLALLSDRLTGDVLPGLRSSFDPSSVQNHPNGMGNGMD